MADPRREDAMSIADIAVLLASAAAVAGRGWFSFPPKAHNGACRLNRPGAERASAREKDAMGPASRSHGAASARR